MKASRIKSFSWHPARIFVCLGLGLIVILLRGSLLLETVERRAYDARVRWMAARTPVSDDIVIVAIDDDSLVRMEDAVGRWPWPRSVYAPLLDYLSGAKAIGFDVLFAEADQQFSRGDDELLALVTEHGHVVSTLYLDNRAGGVVIPDELQQFSMPSIDDPDESIKAFYSALLPFPQLMRASKRLGHMNYLRDRDGAIRRYALNLRLRDMVMPSMALAAVVEYLGVSPASIAQQGSFLTVGESRIRVNPDGTFYYRPSQDAHRVYAIADVLSAWQQEFMGETPDIPRDAFRHKLVLVGSFATGLQVDRKITPVLTDMAGVKIHATAADNLLNQQFFSTLPEWAEILLIMLLTLLASLIRFERPLSFLLTGLVIGFGYIVLVWGFLWWGEWMLPFSGPLSGLVLGVGVLGSMDWTGERLRRRQLEDMELTKQQFTDMLVHDLKNGISSISMSLSMLNRSDAETPELRRQRMLLNTIRAASDRLLTQVHALLDIRKIEEGRMPLIRQEVNLAELIGNLVEHFQAAAEVVGLTLLTRFESAPAQSVNLDPEIFERVMGNLLWNALQYATKTSEVVVTCEDRGEQVLVSIANRGRQIPPDAQAALFTPFVHGKQKTKNVRSVSTGLGLAFCKLAVEAHQGEIRLESPWTETGDGVIVTVSLPMLTKV